MSSDLVQSRVSQSWAWKLFLWLCKKFTKYLQDQLQHNSRCHNWVGIPGRPLDVGQQNKFIFSYFGQNNHPMFNKFYCISLVSNFECDFLSRFGHDWTWANHWEHLHWHGAGGKTKEIFVYDLLFHLCHYDERSMNSKSSYSCFGIGVIFFGSLVA